MAVESAPILALDIGTTSVKASRYTAGGDRVGAVAEVRHRSRTEPSLNLNQVLRAVIDALTRIPAEGVQIIATTTVWQSLVLIDSAGHANPHVSTWETPQPTSIMSTALAKVAQVWDAEATGAFVHSSYPLLAAAAGSDTAREANRLCDIGGWVIETLTGTRVGWSEAIAAGSGMWDRHTRTWNKAIVESTGVRDQLAGQQFFTELAHSASPHPLLPAALHDAGWLPPLPDGLCHNLGVGAVGDIVTATVGTSGSIRAVISDIGARRPEGLWAYRCSQRTLAVGGAISSAGNLLEWVAGLTGVTMDSASLARNEPGLPTLTAIPDVFGRRGPDYPVGATGAILGLRPEHTLHDLAVAFAVDMWSRFATLFSSLDAARAVAAVRAGGGVIERHPISAQLLADALARPVEVPAVAQPALRGVALFGCVALHGSIGAPSVDDVVASIVRGDLATPGTSRRVDPRPAWTSAMHARWDIDSEVNFSVPLPPSLKDTE